MRKALLIGLVLASVAVVIYALRTAQAQPPQSPPSAKWEYRSIVLTSNTNISEFNDVGAEGWELVTVIQNITVGERTRFATEGRAYFKRPKSE